MPNYTPEQIAAMRVSGATVREVEAVLCRNITAKEQVVVDRAMAGTKLQRKLKKERGPKTNAQKVKDFRNRDRLVPYADPEDAKRRARLEKDPAKWLRFYLEDRFPLPFGEVHLKMIQACIRAMVTGSSITIAAPRGFGKTAVEWGMALYGVLTGLCRFPVVIGWKATAGAELLDQWLNALSTNTRLAADYPCQCAPFAESCQSTRLKGILREIETEEKAGCDVRKVRGCVILPDVKEPTTGRTMPQCALAGASMNGSIKGLNIGLLSGESLRPDVALLDDPQDEQTADSPILIKKVIKKIDYGIRSLAGPRRRLTVMAAVTCVNAGDVSEHLLTRPGTEVIITGQITSWPKGWDEKDSATRTLWDAWNQERLTGLENLDGGKRARAFYKAHKAELIEGMAVSWKERFHQSDGLRVGDPDALYAAMWDFYELGESAFMSERQNTPIKEGVTVNSVSAGIIRSRVDKTRAAGVVPEWAKIVIGSTDVNPSYGISTVILAFGNNQRSAVLWYGIHPMECKFEWTDAQKKGYIANELEKHGKEISALPCKATDWVIDGGGSPENTVIDFSATAQRLLGISAITAFGRAGKQYTTREKKEYGVKVREQAHVVRASTLRQWIIWNEHYWLEQAGLAWTGTPSAPGSCELPAGNHDEFAEQASREYITGKVELNGRMIYDVKRSTLKHDFGDCMAQGYAFAAVLGIGTGGGGEVKQSQRKKYTQAELRRA